MKMYMNKAVYFQGHLRLFPSCVLGIVFHINFVPGEYFNSLLNFRESTIKTSPACSKAQMVCSEREGQQFSHESTMG